MTRRELFSIAGMAAIGSAKAAPVSTVAIARSRSYDSKIYGTLQTMFDQVGGLAPVVRNKTVALKLNLTGNPARFPVKAGLPYRTEPSTVLAVCQLMARAGAKRIRILESFFPRPSGHGALGALRPGHGRHRELRHEGRMGEHEQPGPGHASTRG